MSICPIERSSSNSYCFSKDRDTLFFFSRSNVLPLPRSFFFLLNIASTIQALLPQERNHKTKTHYCYVCLGFPQLISLACGGGDVSSSMWCLAFEFSDLVHPLRSTFRFLLLVLHLVAFGSFHLVLGWIMDLLEWGPPSERMIGGGSMLRWICSSHFCLSFQFDLGLNLHELIF